MRKALGRGLSQLIAEQFDSTLSEVNVNSISPNARQPRKEFNPDALDDLASSIRLHGILQPLLVRPVSEGKYELIAGERRLRAAKLAGLSTVPVVIRSTASQSSLELALIENVQREDISAIECGLAYMQLIEEFGLTQEQVAARVGKSRAGVANAMRLLRLPQLVQDSVQNGLLSEGHARALLALPNEDRILEVFYRIVDEGLSVRDVERLVKPEKGKKPATKETTTPHHSQDQALETALREHFMSPVNVRRDSRGGKISIDFYSEEDLMRIIDILKIQL